MQQHLKITVKYLRRKAKYQKQLHPWEKTKNGPKYLEQPPTQDSLSNGTATVYCGASHMA